MFDYLDEIDLNSISHKSLFSSNSLLRNPDFCQQICNQYSPIVKLHEQTLSYPVGLTNLIKTCALYYNGQLKYKPGELTNNILNQFYNNHIVSNNNSHTPSHKIVLEPHDYNGNKDLADDPCYAAIHRCILRMNDTGKKVPVYALKILFNYGGNPGYDIQKNHKGLLGYHDSDIEHVTLYIERAADGTPKDIFCARFARHGTDEGRIIFAKDMEIRDKTHPVIYPAVNSHGNYHKPMLQRRAGNFANDTTADYTVTLWDHLTSFNTLYSSPSHIEWRPKLTNRSSDIFAMHISEGRIHGNTIDTYKKYFFSQDSVVSSTDFTEFFHANANKTPCLFNYYYQIEDFDKQDKEVYSKRLSSLLT